MISSNSFQKKKNNQTHIQTLSNFKRNQQLRQNKFDRFNFLDRIQELKKEKDTSNSTMINLREKQAQFDLNQFSKILKRDKRRNAIKKLNLPVSKQRSVSISKKSYSKIPRVKLKPNKTSMLDTKNFNQNQYLLIKKDGIFTQVNMNNLSPDAYCEELFRLLKSSIAKFGLKRVYEYLSLYYPKDYILFKNLFSKNGKRLKSTTPQHLKLFMFTLKSTGNRRNREYGFSKFKRSEIVTLYNFIDTLNQLDIEKKQKRDERQFNSVKLRINAMDSITDRIKENMVHGAKYKGHAETHFQKMKLKVGKGYSVRDESEFWERRKVDKWDQFVDVRRVLRNKKLMSFSSRLREVDTRDKDKITVLYPHTFLNFKST